MTERECLLEAARFINTDGAELQGDPLAISATLLLVAEYRRPERLMEVLEQHASEIRIGLACALLAALGYRFRAVIDNEKEHGTNA